MIKHSCKYCQKFHTGECTLKPKRVKESTQANKFRSTRKWVKKAIDIKERDNYLCQVCKQSNKLNYTDIEVHHIEPLSEQYDLRLDDDNLITLCVHHHKDAECGKISKVNLIKLISPPYSQM